MKLKLAVALGKDCGHKTIGQTLISISRNAKALFEEDMLVEMAELEQEFKESGLSEDDEIEDILKGGLV